MLAKRDLGVILLALLGVYFSLQNEGVVSFNRAWHVPGDAIDDATQISSIRYRTAPRMRTPLARCSST
jgi:hypothetical protein